MNQVMERKMHLTDQALLEPTVSDRAHLVSCLSCRKRYEQLNELQRKLSAFEPLDLPPSLEKMSDFMLDEIEQLKSKQAPSNQAIFWRQVSIGLAASLLLSLSVAGYFGFAYFENQGLQVANVDQGTTEGAVLDNLIASNRDLQSRLINGVGKIKLVSSDTKQLEQKLAMIDSAIQHAYLVGSTKSKKSNLWQERLDILQAMLEQQKIKRHRNRFRI